LPEFVVGSGAAKIAVFCAAVRYELFLYLNVCVLLVQLKTCCGNFIFSEVKKRKEKRNDKYLMCV
jgi:hypothetical protein